MSFCNEVEHKPGTIITNANSQEISEVEIQNKNINLDLVYQLITNGVTIIVAFIAGYLPSYLNKKNETQKSKSEKLEFLYIEVSEWFNSSFLGLSFFNLVLNKQMTPSQYDEWINKNTPNNNYLKCEINLYLYFPNLENEYKEMIKSVQDAYTYTWSIKNKQIITNEERQKFDLFVLKTNSTFEKLKNKMIEESRHCR